MTGKYVIFINNIYLLFSKNLDMKHLSHHCYQKAAACQGHVIYHNQMVCCQ